MESRDLGTLFQTSNQVKPFGVVEHEQLYLMIIAPFEITTNKHIHDNEHKYNKTRTPRCNAESSRLRNQTLPRSL